MCCDRINSSQALVSHSVEWGKRYLLFAQSTKNTLLIFPPVLTTDLLSDENAGLVPCLAFSCHPAGILTQWTS